MTRIDIAWRLTPALALLAMLVGCSERSAPPTPGSAESPQEQRAALTGAATEALPATQRIVWTSTRDHMDMPLGNWFDDVDYPRSAELYISDLEGKNIRRLTNNRWYDAEVSITRPSCSAPGRPA